jgi:hypothetical protein
VGATRLGRRWLVQVALPAAVAVTPVLVGALRAWSNRAGIWLWGDQALIDIEARNSLLGRNLLGVYDRYGWHHLGPLWLQVLGVSRWLAGGSPVGVAIGFYALQALAVVAIVVVAYRLRPGLTAWWAALVLLGYEWSFGLERLGTVWAPYAIALPTALLVLLVAKVTVSRDPWPATIAAAICGSFLCQTDIGTVVLVGVLLVAAPFLRVATRAAVGTEGDGAPDAAPVGQAWGWATERWRLRAATLAAVLGLLWLPTVLQQITTRPGNLVQAYHFLASHHSVRTIRVSLKAADTLFGWFPFRADEETANHDANPAWLISRASWDHPWFLLYIAGAVAVGVVALAARKLPALALAAATSIAILAAGWSILLVYGPLFPYLILWTGALVIPAWIAAWLVMAPALALSPAAEAPETRRAGRFDRVGRERARRLTVPATSVAAAAAVCAAFAVGDAPLTDGSAHLARGSWAAVAEMALAPRVKTVYVDVVGQNAMPEAAAIADQIVRHDRRLEVNGSALYYFDPSFAPRWPAQLRIVVCCGRGDPGRPGPGSQFRARVGGQRIYTLAGGATSRPTPLSRPTPAPVGRRLWPPTYELGRPNGRPVHAL